MRKGAPWLKTTLIQCAWAAARKKASYLQAQFYRLRGRRGARKAIGAVAASILTAAYHMLISGELYRDLCPAHFAGTGKAYQTHRLVAKSRLCRADHASGGMTAAGRPMRSGVQRLGSGPCHARRVDPSHVYHMLIGGEIYHALSPDHFDRRAKTAQTSRLVMRLENLGYAVQLTPLPASA
jgi:hypothetical protein